MALDEQAAKKILGCIDRNELAKLGSELTSIPSPTGQEKAIAEFILAWFEGNRIKAVRQDVEPDRPNAVGIIKGDGFELRVLDVTREQGVYVHLVEPLPLVPMARAAEGEGVGDGGSALRQVRCLMFFVIPSESPSRGT